MAVLVGKPKIAVNMKFVDRVVREYFNTIQGVSLTGKEVSELFRYCVCVILSLDSRIAPSLEELSKLVINKLDSLDGWPVLVTRTERCTLLEVFVHVMESVRVSADM